MQQPRPGAHAAASFRTTDGAFDGDGRSFRRSNRTTRFGAARTAILRSMDGTVADIPHDGAPARFTLFSRELWTCGRVVGRRRSGVCGGSGSRLRFARSFRRVLRTTTRETSDARDEQDRESYATHRPLVAHALLVRPNKSPLTMHRSSSNSASMLCSSSGSWSRPCPIRIKSSAASTSSLRCFTVRRSARRIHSSAVFGVTTRESKYAAS